MIGMFDSGIGGLTILNVLKELVPNEDYLYYADSKNNPYGEKSDEQLLEICSGVVDYLIEHNCKIIVIACNTATTKCMKKLRDKYKDIVFVGTVPAIKVASDGNYKNTLVMATPATIESERTYELVRDNKRDDQNIYLVPCSGLAHAIEVNDQDTINSIIDSIYDEYKDKNIDSIVLGCTHYPYIKDIIYSKFKCDLLDGSLGVSKEVKRQLELNNLVTNSGSGEVTIYKSGD